MTDLSPIAAIVAAAEYTVYGVRAHRAEAEVGAYLGKSRVWVDGEMTDDELGGISTIKVTDEASIAKAIGLLRREYCWGGAQIVLVGGHEGEWGEDAGEYIISDNVCLAVL